MAFVYAFLTFFISSVAYAFDMGLTGTTSCMVSSCNGSSMLSSLSCTASAQNNSSTVGTQYYFSTSGSTKTGETKFRGNDNGLIFYRGCTQNTTACPANSTSIKSAGFIRESTGTTVYSYSCECNSGYTYNGASCVPIVCVEGTHLEGETCVANCPKGQIINSGYYDFGTDSSASPTILSCSAGCEALFSGTWPSISRIVDGQRHYFAQGGYDMTGNTCATNGQSPAAISAPPADTCSVNQSRGEVNGVIVCLDNATGQSTTPIPAKTTTTKTTTNETTPEGTISTTTTTNPDGTTTTETTTYNTTTNTTTTVIEGTQTAGETAQAMSDGMTAYCQAHPDLASCQALGTDTAGPPVNKTEYSMSFSPGANPFGAGSCPAPLPVLGEYLTFDLACDAMVTIAPLVRALGGLVAVFVLLGALKDG